MTKQEKQLLLIDLCSRLPYGVKIHETSSTTKMEPFIPLGIEGTNIIRKDYRCESTNYIGRIGIERCLPYLRPMSSMTAEEKRTYTTLRAHALPFTIVAWLDENMFDHRTNSEGEHLIESGIALEAKEGMYK